MQASCVTSQHRIKLGCSPVWAVLGAAGRRRAQSGPDAIPPTSGHRSGLSRSRSTLHSRGTAAQSASVMGDPRHHWVASRLDRANQAKLAFEACTYGRCLNLQNRASVPPAIFPMSSGTIAHGYLIVRSLCLRTAPVCRCSQSFLAWKSWNPAPLKRARKS